MAAARTAFITGILGQDGSLLAELLLSRGYRVVGAARTGSKPPDKGPLSAVPLVTDDLTDRAAVRSLLEQWRPDELYHLAAFHHSSQDNSASAEASNKEAMLGTNFLATKTLAMALVELRSACHLVYASSSQIYTAKPPVLEVTEATPRQPATFYGHTKSWSMDLLAFLRQESGLRTSTAILFNHESSRRREHFVSRKITRAAASAAMGGHPTLHLHNIGARVDWSSASDVVQALGLMGRSDEPRDFVVASGKLRSVRDFVRLAFERVGLDWQRFTTVDEDRAGAALLGRTDALEGALGWRRQTSFEDLVAEMVDYDVSVASRSAQLPDRPRGPPA